MVTTAISEKQAQKWGRENGFHKLPKGLQWQFCYGAQFSPRVGDAKYLRSDDRDLYGIIGFRKDA